MRTNDYVIINNRAYDPITGLPIEGASGLQQGQTTIKQPIRREVERSTAIRGVATPTVHRSPQKSATLSRRYVRRPAIIEPLERTATTEAKPIIIETTKQAASIAPKPTFSKFTQPTAVKVNRPDRPAEKHPAVRRAEKRQMDMMTPRQQKQKTAIKQLDRQVKPVETKTLKPASILKNEAIAKAMNQEIASQKQPRVKKQRNSGRWARFATMATASLAIVLLGGYLTYLSMPNLSIKMAAVQSGINAKYPGYRPDGYALNGPITFKDGEVSMQFAYAGGDQDFIIKQQRSGWDSSAVREYVEKQSYETTTTAVDGLTIYTYGSNAAWVNGGVLYTIEGTAPLSGDQIRRIATSM